MVEFYRNSAEANNISHFKCLFQAMLNYTLNHPFLYYDTSNLGRSKDEKSTSMWSFGIPVLVSTNLVIPTHELQVYIVVVCEAQL